MMKTKKDHTIIPALLMCSIIVILNACQNAVEASEIVANKTTIAEIITPNKTDSTLLDSIPLGLKKIIAAYPEQGFKATKNHLIWADGSRMLFQDETQKSFEELLNNPDLEDQLAMVYPRDTTFQLPSRNHDPGRVRVEEFFFKMYGNSKEVVQQKLVEIEFMGAKLLVSKVNSIDKKLTAISEKLSQLPAYSKYLENVGGTFNWRKIAGTERMSTHSFGMTIDINVKYSNYWRWAVEDKSEDGKRPIIYKNQIPLEIVRIFEEHGFIWGGKWYHYDTMHFEYRPELL